MQNRINLLIALTLGLGLLLSGCSTESGLSAKVPDAVVKPGADKPGSTTAPEMNPKGKKGAAPMMPPP